MKSGFLGSPNRRILLGVAERDGGSARQLVQSYSAVMGGGAIITPTPGTPTLKSLTPNVGPQGGGTSVTIIGQNFFGTGIQVFFGGTACPTVVVNSPTQLTVVTPQHALGLVSVVVVTQFGVGLLLNSFTFQPPADVVFAIGNSGLTSGVGMGSPDGINWHSITVPNASGTGWNAIARSGSIFCAITADGSHSMSSPTGVTWTLGPTGPATAFATCGSNFIWDGTRFVAIGRQSTQSSSAISNDGINWATNLIGTSSDATCALAFSGIRYIAWGASAGSAYLYRSSDAVNWNVAQFPSKPSAAYTTQWNGSQFVALFHNNGWLTSPDGLTWTAGSMPGDPDASYLGLAWNGSIWAAAGGNSLSQGLIATSPDGQNWTARTVPTPPSGGTAFMLNMIWSPGLGLFIACGYSGAIYSPDGINWSAGQGVPLYNWQGLASMV